MLRSGQGKEDVKSPALVSSQTTLSVLYNRYKVVMCLDISNSVASVIDGEVLITRLYTVVHQSLSHLTDPLIVGYIVIQPEIYLSVLAQGMIVL